MVFGKLVSGSEKNEQTRQVADIRSRVLEEACKQKAAGIRENGIMPGHLYRIMYTAVR